MESANFIPLGDTSRRMAFDSAAMDKNDMVAMQSRTIGKTKEDRKAIAREHRLAARREKKKIKADAKRQRKQNAIMHRRMTRNNEKYVTNKDRNKQRAIDLERNKIRFTAVKQAESLAAKHDQSGKLFNVGEVIVLEDGSVKSKAVYERNQAEKKKVEETLAAEAAGPLEGMNPERQAQIQDPKTAAQKKSNLSRKQQKLQAMLAPKPVPPKPVIPEGYSVPKEEENFVALWDITDEDILKRLANQKREKSSAAKALRRAQKEKKKYNRAIKALKKEAANKKIMWDPGAARKDVLGLERWAALEAVSKKKKAAGEVESDSSSESDSDSESESGSESEVEWESDDEVKAKKEAKKGKKRTQSSTSEKSCNDENGAYTKNFPNRPKLNLALLQAAEDKERSLIEKKRIAREARRAERKALARQAEEEAKKKAEEDAVRAPVDTEMADVEDGEHSRKRKRDADGEEDGGKKKKRSRKDIIALKKQSKAAAKGLVAPEITTVAPFVTNGGSGTIVTSNDDKLDAIIAQRELEMGNTEVVEEEPNKKKSKRSKHSEAVKDSLPEPVEEPAGKPEKKHKKEKKSKHIEVITISDDENNEAEVTIPEKKHKKDKSEKKARKAAKEAAATEASSHQNGAEQWNPDALAGDDARKDKFLRLLGAGKNNSSVVNGGSVEKIKKKKDKESGKVDDIRKTEAELERQFEAGVKMKHDSGGKRRGLGA